MCKSCRTVERHLSSRRGFLLGAAGAAIGAAMLPPRSWGDTATKPQNMISPQEALDRLMAGNTRYVANAPEVRDYSAGRAARAAGQYPIAAILSCADSRVSPELVFDQNPGDLFVVRLAGNFVDDDGLASLEYGVKFLGAPLVMVLGHSSCGAVDAAIKVLDQNLELPGHLPELIDSIKPAVERAKAASPASLLEASIAENVRLNVERLTTAEPIMKEAASAQQIRVVGGVYEIATGKVELL
jgi:carbonic anhydrase